MKDVDCIGLEAALSRVDDYAKWGFKPSSPTTRWQLKSTDKLENSSYIFPQDIKGLTILEGSNIPSDAVQNYDVKRELSPRPHFLLDWIHHPEGKVLALMDRSGECHGFGRIRPCLLKSGTGWRVGPLLADHPQLAETLLRRLIVQHPGIILIDSPGLNTSVHSLLRKIGFISISETLRMYKGYQPPLSMDEVYGLACLELG